MIQFPNIDKICQSYNYPKEINVLLKYITKPLIIPGTKSLLLIGSASRGELVFKQNRRGLVLFSDLELVVITKRNNLYDKQKALKKIDYIEKKQRIIGARTFHIDVSFTTVQRWKRLKQKFHAWEIKNTGQVLYGENFLGLLRANVEPKYTIQSSFNRLLYLLLFLPISFFEKKPTKEDLESFNFILSRAILDFPIWMLCSKGILIPGFKERYEYLKGNKYLFDENNFPIDNLIEVVGVALKARNNLKFDDDILSFYKTLLCWYPKILSWELKINNDKIDLLKILQRYDDKIYPTLNWKRYLWETRLAAALAKKTSSKQAFSWLIKRKQVLISGFLWCMHMAVLEYLYGNNLNANEWLERAQLKIDELWPNGFPKKRCVSFSTTWTALRYRFFDFLPRFYRGLGQNTEYFKWVLKNF